MTTNKNASSGDTDAVCLFDTILLGMISEYDEQHTKVCRNEGYIYLGLESRGGTALSKSFKVVRYLSSNRER